MKSLPWQKLLQEALTNPGKSRDTYCKFYPYSFGNRMLFAMQGLKEPVATFKKWLELERMVVKGSKAYLLWVPRIVKDKETKQDRFAGCVLLNRIFGYSQTHGSEIVFPELPQWNKEKALENLGIKEIPFEDTNGNIMGYYSPGRGIAINPVNKQPLKTTFHEISHHLMGHKESNPLTEFQAETCAYILMHEVGMEFDKEESRFYIQNWLKDNVPENSSIQQVFGTVEKILKAGI